MAERKSTSTRLPFSRWPLSLLSHGVWAPNATVKLSPLARVRERGEIDSTAKSAIRALDIVELLARAGKPLRAVEISNALALSRSSAHQLLKSMMDSAYLIFDPISKRYHPSLRAANIGGSLAASYYGLGAIDRLVDAIHQELETPLTISASQGSFMQILDVFEPGRDASGLTHDAHDLRQDSIGLRVPIFGSCTGAAWLSAQSDEVVLAIVRLCRRALGRQASDAEQILEIVRRVREQGYAFGGVSADDARRSIAVPFPPSRDGIILVMAVSAPTHEIGEKRDEFVAILKENIARYLIADDCRSGDVEP